MKSLITEFYEIFGKREGISSYFAPGRVNLIGEHTDYNGGHVFPCALTIGTYAVVKPNESGVLRFYSKNFESLGVIECHLDDLTYKEEDNWTNYPKAIIWAMKQRGYEVTKGMDILYYGTIPNGSGLSSSASIEVLTAYILNDLYSFGINNVDIAVICQEAENKFVGVNCGIMDQFAIAMGKTDSAIFLDTSNLQFEYAPLALNDIKIVIMNTNKKRGLGDSKYNERRSECERALQDLQKVCEINNLCDLTLHEFEQHKDIITDEVCRRRAKHAIYENQRTIMAVKALEEGNLDLLGKLMIDSHLSLKNDYEVTGIELDTLVEEALLQEGVLGARMTGAGFGGCAISLVKHDYVEKFMKEVGEKYQSKIGYAADFYVVSVGDGPKRCSMLDWI